MRGTCPWSQRRLASDAAKHDDGSSASRAAVLTALHFVTVELATQTRPVLLSAILSVPVAALGPPQTE